MSIAPYTAAAVQTHYVPCREAIDRWVTLVDYAVDWHGTASEPLGRPPLRLLAFPQLTSPGWWQAPEGAHAAALELPGEEIAPLLDKAREHAVFIASAAFERDADWPGHVFNTAFVAAPDGTIVHRQRQIAIGCQALGRVTSPYDVLDEYVERYGAGRSVLETLLPVTETEIGRLATCTTDDALYAELVRALVLNGAEVVIRPVEWLAGTYPLGPGALRLVNQQRCYDNVIYLLAPNTARARGGQDAPEHVACGETMIVDHFGKAIARAEANGEQVVTATIDVAELRRRRRSPGFNYPAQLLCDIYADVWKTHAQRGLGLAPNAAAAERAGDHAPTAASIAALHESGIYQRPEQGAPALAR